jgi:hypothetical protein
LENGAASAATNGVALGSGGAAAVGSSNNAELSSDWPSSALPAEPA